MLDVNVDELLSSSPLPFLEKVKRLLTHLLAQQSGPLGTPVDLSSPRIDAMLQTLNRSQDLGFYMPLCRSLNNRDGSLQSLVACGE
jgi:hypothetical protein